MKFPKLIHYCWISEDPFPPLVKKCIKSWKTIMPDYKLILWDRKRCEALNIPFINDAIQMKKYAFAADVVRVMALYQEGGIYLDSDVLLKKNLETLLNDDFVSFIEFYPHLYRGQNFKKKKREFYKVRGIGLQATVMASLPGHPFLKDLIEFYSTQRLNKRTIKFFTTFIAPDIQASILKNYGFKYIDKTQKLIPNITIYNSQFLESNSTFNYSESFGIHFCQGSWITKPTLLDRIVYAMKRSAYLCLKTFNLIPSVKTYSEEK